MGHSGHSDGWPPHEVMQPRHSLDALVGLPKPTAGFRRRAWVVFQRALDPLAPLKPLRRPRA